jgi:ubiquinone/menaquinone biosynthesis C-methylase UbiE
MNNKNTFHLSAAAVDIYENQKVPAMFKPLAKATLEKFNPSGSVDVLDVACGTGVVSRLLSEKLVEPSRIVGTDLNPAMVEVAKRQTPASIHNLEWFAADVAELPFGDGEFDVVFCQQGLQFFPDRLSALREIRRVLKGEGYLILTCWRSVSPLFQSISNSLRVRLSEGAAKQAVAPFGFRDEQVITQLCSDAGFGECTVSTLKIDRVLTPPHGTIRNEILASTYENEIRGAGEEILEAIVSDVVADLEGFRRGDSLVIPQESSLFQGR